jgi:hypothetical protein
VMLLCARGIKHQVPGSGMARYGQVVRIELYDGPAQQRHLRQHVALGNDTAAGRNGLTQEAVGRSILFGKSGLPFRVTRPKRKMLARLSLPCDEGGHMSRMAPPAGKSRPGTFPTIKEGAPGGWCAARPILVRP